MKKKKKNQHVRLILCTDQEGIPQVTVRICEYLCDGPLSSSLNFEPFELDCHCIPLLMVFLVTTRTALIVSFYLFFFWCVWAKPLVV